MGAPGLWLRTKLKMQFLIDITIHLSALLYTACYGSPAGTHKPSGNTVGEILRQHIVDLLTKNREF